MDQTDPRRASAHGATPGALEQFGATFFMITGFHGTHVTIGVIFLLIVARKVLRGDFEEWKGRLLHKPPGCLRERRDHGALLAFCRSRLGLYLRIFLPLVRLHMAATIAHVLGTRGSSCHSDGPA